MPETLEKEKQLEARAKKEKRENLFQQMSRALKSPYAFMLILVFVLNFGIMNFESIFGLYVDRKHGFTASDIALIITAAGLVGRFCAGGCGKFLSRQVRREKSDQWDAYWRGGRPCFLQPGPILLDCFRRGHLFYDANIIAPAGGEHTAVKTGRRSARICGRYEYGIYQLSQYCRSVGCRFFI